MPVRLFMFRLALSFGCTIKELCKKMDSRELTEWMVYYSIEPWGSAVQGHRDALTCSTIANTGLFTAAPSLLRKKPFHPSDFEVTASKKRNSQDWKSQKRIMDKNMSMINDNLK